MGDEPEGEPHFKTGAVVSALSGNGFAWQGRTFWREHWVNL